MLGKTTAALKDKILDNRLKRPAATRAAVDPPRRNDRAGRPLPVTNRNSKESSA